MDDLDMLRVARSRLDDPAALAMQAEVQEEYVVRYGGPDASPMDHGAFLPPDGCFLVARADGMPVGMVGFRRHDAASAEIKRLYVRAAYRRRGISRALLEALEGAAVAAGYRRLVLNTGERQPEAVALYRTAGYVPVAGFGHYADSPLAVFLGKELGPG